MLRRLEAGIIIPMCMHDRCDRRLARLDGAHAHRAWPGHCDHYTVGCKSFGRNIRLGFKQQQQDLIYNHLCLRK